MTTIGYATLAIIPSLDGVSEAIDKQLGGKLVASGKKGGKALAKGVGEGLKDLESAVDSAAKSYDKLRDKAKDSLGKVRVEEEKLAKARSGGKSDQIAAAEERLNKARRDSGRATRDAEQGHKTLLDSQKRLASGADDTGRRLGSLGSSMRTVGTIAGGAALAGITALATGVVVAGRELYQLGAQFDDLNDTIQVKTGLSGAALDKLTASVEKLGTTNVPSSFADIGEVAAEVTRNLHLTGQPLEEVTSRLANLARWGQSADVRSLGKVFNGFKIGAEDQAGALNNLYEVSTKTGLSIDDLTGAMANGGAPLRALNLGFNDSVGLMVAFEQAGLNGEKAQTALNKAFGYFADEGIPAEEGLANIIDRIRELGDTPEAGELAKKVFGGKSGAQFFEAIQNGDLDLQTLQSSLQLTGLDINQISDDTADWAEKWQDLKNEFAVALKPAAVPFFEGVNEELGKLADWVEEHPDEVIDFFLTIGNGAITAADVVMDAVGQMAEGIGQFIQPFGDIQGAMLDFQAWQAEIRDDDETAKELRAQAQEAYGWGEGLDAAGRAMRDFEPQSLRDKLDEIGDAAKGSKVNIHDLSEEVGKLSNRTIDLKTTINGQTADLGSWFSTPGAPAGTNPLDVFAPGTGGGSGGFGGVGPGGRPTPGSGLPSLKDLPPLTGGPGGKYGLPAGTDIRQGAEGFPDWVYQVADAFGLKASTYSGHQEDGGQGNQGIDWWGPVENRQAFAEFLAANAGNIPGLEDVIYRNPETGQDIGVNSGRLVGTPGSADPGYFRRGKNDFLDHDDHVHTTQNAPIPLPNGATARLSSDSGGSGGLPGSLYQDASGQWRSSLPSWDHLIQRESAGVNQVQSPNTVDVNTGGNEAEGLFQITPKTWAAHGGTRFAPTAIEATPQEQAEIAAAIFSANPSGSDWGAGLSGRENPSQLLAELNGSGSSSVGGLPPGASTPTALNNAFGPGFEPGIGTPGRDEYGDPGYYRVDPRDVKDAQDRIADQMERIREADEARKQAQVAIEDLEVDADQAEIDAANERKRKADYDAEVARRELGDLKLDLGEAQQGSFTPAKEAPKSKKGGSGSGLDLGSSLSGIGSALGEFAGGQIGSALEVFGVGDSPGWLKGISTFISGIGVSDSEGNSLFDGSSPLSANQNFGASPDGSTHGTQAGQPPGPTYNIHARDTEDAFVKAQRVERERSAAKLSRF